MELIACVPWIREFRKSWGFLSNAVRTSTVKTSSAVLYSIQGLLIIPGRPRNTCLSMFPVLKLTPRRD